MKTHNAAARAALEEFKRRIEAREREAFWFGAVVGAFATLLALSTFVRMVTP